MIRTSSHNCRNVSKAVAALGYALSPAFVMGAGLALAVGPLARATDIIGVQMAAMDQPRVSMMFRRAPKAEPLSAKGDADLAQLLGLDTGGDDKVSLFAAYLDTGASGILISAATADSLGIKRLQTVGGPNPKPVVFHDVGLGGTDTFAVSETLYLTCGPYQSLDESTADNGSFANAGGPWRCQIGPLNGGGLLESLVGPVDVVGMPAMIGKVVVLDPGPVNKFEDVIQVRILDGRNGKVPATNRHVKLSYADFAPFTYTDPADAGRPVATPNPFIGTGPADKTARQAPRIVMRHGGKLVEGAWLLDTGAVASMISTKQAAALGVRYQAGTENTDAPLLEGVPPDKQFTLSLGGVGGMKKAAGFLVDELQVPTVEGDTLVYRAAPVLVNDITVEHPLTKQKVTLDGIFGMNLLVASAQVTDGPVPGIDKMSEGPYDLIVIDHLNGLLGLQLRKDLGH